jgi:hypothetical protein
MCGPASSAVQKLLDEQESDQRSPARGLWRASAEGHACPNSLGFTSWGMGGYGLAGWQQLSMQRSGSAVDLLHDCTHHPDRLSRWILESQSR